MRTETIILPFPPSSNMAYPSVTVKPKKGKPFSRRVKSERAKEWEAGAPDYSDIEPFKKCTISYKIFFPNDRICDGQSYLKLPLDYIVSQGIVEDDNRRIVKGEQWIDAGNDKENPRIEITIREIE